MCSLGQWCKFVSDCPKQVEIFLIINKIDIHKTDERYQLDATILFIIINISTCFGHLYAHLQEYRLYTTAYGVQQ